MNYASGPSSSVNPYVFSSATSNNKQTIPVVIADSDASSGGKAALGVVNNMDQAKPNIDNATTMKAMGQSQLYGNGNIETGDFGAQSMPK